GRLLRHSFPTDERDVSATYRVGVRLQLESRIPGHYATEVAAVDIGAECDGETHSDLAVSKTGRFVDHQDTPHQVCALGHTRLQQVLRGHERRHVRNVDVLGGHRKETADGRQRLVNPRLPDTIWS